MKAVSVCLILKIPAGEDAEQTIRRELDSMDYMGLAEWAQSTIMDERVETRVSVELSKTFSAAPA